MHTVVNTYTSCIAYMDYLGIIYLKDILIIVS
jgi:hypothetical protein